jgi:pimeloyl-ACP methyl ester carboxylesterase
MDHASTFLHPAGERTCTRLAAPAEPALVLQRQGPADAALHVLYVHGATFGAELSVFRRFGGRSWADALADAGATVHGFDFAGYGRSDRHPADAAGPVGRLAQAERQLARVVAHLHAELRPARLALLAHSWGGAVAARHVALGATRVDALVLFAPVVPRTRPFAPSGIAASHVEVSLLAQYRRFVADVPRGEAQVLDEAAFEAWGRDWLATDPGAHARAPAAVRVPAGPAADVDALWSGERLVDASRIACPTLVVRGEWDSVFDDADAAALLAELGAAQKQDVRLARGTHLMHLESGRGALHAAVAGFLRQLG